MTVEGSLHGIENLMGEETWNGYQQDKPDQYQDSQQLVSRSSPSMQNLQGVGKYGVVVDDFTKIKTGARRCGCW